MWDAVPWFVGGNAKHSEEVARTLAFIASGGGEGVAQPGDLKVVPTTVPSGQLIVSAGGAMIRNRGANSYEQSYIGINLGPDPVQLAETGAIPRVDMIVGRVEDLNAVGGSQWQGNGADPDDGPFMFSRVIENVPATATRLQDVVGHENDVGIALARVAIPANTGTILASMITDLRKLARPRSERQIVKADPTDYYVTMAAGQWKPFPNVPLGGLVVPEWATHAVIRAETAMKYLQGDAYANFRGFIGLPGEQATANLFSTFTIDASAGGGQYRQPFIMPSEGLFSIPASMRGKTVQITGAVQPVSSGGNGARIGTAAGDYLFADVTFMERAA